VRGKKIGGWMVRDGIAAVGCSSMGAGSIGGKNYCGNLLWQSSVTLLPLLPPREESGIVSRVEVERWRDVLTQSSRVVLAV